MSQEKTFTPLAPEEENILSFLMPTFIQTMEKNDSWKGPPLSPLSRGAKFSRYPKKLVELIYPTLLATNMAAVRMLHSALEADVETGNLSAETADRIASVFSIASTVDRSLGLGFVWNPKVGQKDEFPMNSHFLKYGRQKGLSDKELEIVAEKMAPISARCEQLAITTEQLRMHHFLEDWQRGKLKYPYPLLSQPQDLELVCDTLKDTLQVFFHLDQDTVKKGVAALRERVEAHEEVLRTKEAQNAAYKAEKMARKPSAAPPKQEWQLGPNNTPLIFDASALRKLIAPRKSGGSWLDLLTCTAELPPIKIIISSFDADLVLQGRIPKHDEQGHHIGFEQVDPRFAKNGDLYYIGEPVSKFLAGAARIRLNSNDTITWLSSGINDNVIIVETPDLTTARGERADDLIREITQEESPIKRIEQCSAKLKDEHLGRRAINYIITHAPFDNPLTVVTNNRRYLDHAAYLTSKQGKPVGQASTASYLQAEIRARAPELQEKLHETKEITLERINEKIDNHLKRHSPQKARHSDHFFLYSKSGQYNKSGEFGENIDTVIQHAVDESRRSKTTWSGDASLSKNIAPDEVRKHPRKGAERA